jgi:hypothetical protein
VPEVQTSTTGRLLALARPSPRNAAERSSIRTCSRGPARPSAEAEAAARSNSAIASGALREPGASTASRKPHLISSSTNTVPNAVDGFMVRCR